MPTTPTDNNSRFASPTSTTAKPIPSYSDEPAYNGTRIHVATGGTNTVHSFSRPFSPLPPSDLSSVHSLVDPALTDMGNAERLLRCYGSKILYCADLGSWLIWDGVRWREDRNGTIERLAKNTVTQFNTAVGAKTAEYNVAHEDKKKYFEQLIRFARGSQNANKIAAMIHMAESDKPVDAKLLDSDEHLLNCLNGTIDLRTGKLIPHTQNNLCTKLAPVTYDPSATCPIFDAFLNRIMNNNKALIGFLQRAFGYGLTGSARDRVMFFLIGSGNNGKTTLLEIFKVILGDYAGQITANALMTKTDSDADMLTNALLKGRRFVTSSEAEQGAKLAEARVKQMTGGGSLMGRRLCHSPFEFSPTHKLFVDANYKPKIRYTDNAIWNRIRLIPFEVTIPTEEIDAKLPDKLRAETSGILAWAVRGCVEWQRHGLGNPNEISAAVVEYRDQMDIVKEFIEDKCELSPSLKTKNSELHAAYATWCAANNHEIMTPNEFVNRLAKTPGLTSYRTSSGRGWQGIGLSEPIETVFQQAA